MFPRHARQIVIDKKVITPFHALTNLYNQGFRQVVMVAGSDRVQEYNLRLNKYNGKKGTHGFYNFKGGIKIVNAGGRDPDAEGAEGASGTKQRSYASNNDFTGFAQGLPKSMSNADAKKLFNDVRKGMGLKEEHEFKRHLQLESVSEIREVFARGELFEVGQEVIIEKTGEIGQIQIIGSNYIIVDSNGQRTRQWPEAVTVVEYMHDYGTPSSVKYMKKKTPGQNEQDERKKGSPQDPDIKDRPGTQPKAYHAGVSKKTKAARDRHFKKGAKMDDDNPKAYKKAPGDAGAKTKPSKHTMRFKQMFGEEDKPGHVDRIKNKINREKERDKQKHDRMMDIARIRDTQAKNKATK